MFALVMCKFIPRIACYGHVKITTNKRRSIVRYKTSKIKYWTLKTHDIVYGLTCIDILLKITASAAHRKQCKRIEGLHNLLLLCVQKSVYVGIKPFSYGRSKRFTLKPSDIICGSKGVQYYVCEVVSCIWV